MSQSDTPLSFHHTPDCSWPGCERPAVHKIAAGWSDGTFHELKTYGFACELHSQSILERGNQRRLGIRLIDGEHIDSVAVYRLKRGTRDVDLERLT